MLSARVFRPSLYAYKTVRLISNTRVCGLPVVQFKLSDIGEGIAEVQIKEWHVKVGDKVSQFDNLCEVQSDKASVTITSRYDGVITKLYHEVDGMARVGHGLIDIEIEGEAEADSPKEEDKTDSGSATTKKEAASAKTSSISSSAAGNGKVLATPAVRRIAMENKINLSSVPATGKDGRVLKEDVLKFMGQVQQDHSSGSTNIRTSPAGGGAVAVQKFAPLREDKAVPIRGYARAMIKSMSEALKIPHFGYNDEYNVEALVRVREELKGVAKERGIKLSYMPFFIKACSLALVEYPSLNAITEPSMENVIHKASHNICLAMDTPGGLVVPNIKNCEQRSVLDIAAELKRLQEAGAKQQISREDLQDGTFSLSNIGAIGGTYASPVIFPPQVAIGAIGKMERLPRFDRHNNVVSATVVKLSWAADHRVVDGATMARFSNRMKSYLEKPSTMLALLK